MNERTKKLAIIANPSSQEIYESDSWQFNCAAWSADDLEKFAELIVGECFYCVEIMEKIAHASNADIPPDYDQHTYLKTLEAVTGLMKAHFGVEL
jgi:hypothetical protein